jgi:acetyl-CoA decarbonylase/synthase complex subunit gamma
VVFGPVRAADIVSFLAAGMKATPEMRRVHFPFWERVALIPVELVTLAKWPLLVATLLFLFAGLGRDGYSWQRGLELGLPTAIMVLLTSFGSLALGPVLLPWLPGRAFSLKGLWVGLAFLVLFQSSGWFAAAARQNPATTLGWILLVPSAASVLVMAFTGASTYTSLSGVQREMKIAMPLQLCAAAVGLVAWFAGRFV